MAGWDSQRLVLVHVLVLYTGLCAAGQYPICDIPCCDVTPSCSEAWVVGCNCRDGGLITLSKGDIPPSVQAVYIVSRKQLMIRGHTFYNMSSLKMFSIDLRRQASLYVEENGLAFKYTSIRLEIENAETVFFQTSAIKGFWNDDAVIKMQGIRSLITLENSFSFTSKGTGPSVIIEDVSILPLSPHSLNAPIKKLRLTNVYMPACLNGTFGQQISHLELLHVKVDVISAGCINSSSMNGLSIQSSAIQTVHSRGISGKLGSLELKKTSLKTIEQDGLSVQVAKFQVTKCDFGELQTSGLVVTAQDTIDLENVKIKTLRKDALKRLQVYNAQQELLIFNMEVQQLEKGSLSFDENTVLSLNGDLIVPAPDPSACPVDKWVRWLVGEPEDSKLSPNNERIIQNLERVWHCPTVTSTTLTPNVPNENGRNDFTELPLGDDSGDSPRTSHMMVPATQTTPMPTPPEETSTEATFETDASSLPPTDGDQQSESASGGTSGLVLGLILSAVAVTAVVGGVVNWVRRRNATPKGSASPQHGRDASENAETETDGPLLSSTASTPENHPSSAQ